MNLSGSIRQEKSVEKPFLLAQGRFSFDKAAGLTYNMFNKRVER